jgi:hypothetical protein
MHAITKAYFTVEAAMIMPLVLSVYVFILYALAFLYNRALFEQDIFLLTLRGVVSQEGDVQKRIEKVKEETKQIYWDKYLWLRWEDPFMEIKGERITITANAFLMGAGKTWMIESVQSSTVIQPVRFIRGVQKIKELLFAKDTDDSS